MNAIVLMPDSNKKLAWDLFANLSYLSSIFISSSIIAFRMLIFAQWSSYEIFFDVVIFIDMCLYFITAYEDAKQGDENEKYNKNLKHIMVNYLTTYFIFDAISVLPCLTFEIVYLFMMKKTVVELSNITAFHWIYLLKMMRLNQIPRILQQFSSQVKFLERKFTNQLIGLINTKRIIISTFTLMFLLHIFSIIWIYIGLEENGWYRKVLKDDI